MQDYHCNNSKELIEPCMESPDPEEAEPGGEFSLLQVCSTDSSDKFTKRANQPS